MIIPAELQCDYEQVNRGRDIVSAIKERNRGDDTICWVLLPENQEELNHLATGEILLDYMERKCCQKAIILSPDREQEEPKCMKVTRGLMIQYLTLGMEEFAAVLSYCRLVPFAQNLIIVSLQEPYSFSAWIGHFGISLEMFVRNALFFGSQINWLWWNTDIHEVELAIENQIKKLQEKRLYLYGWTRDAQTIIRSLESKGFFLTGVLDSDPKKNVTLPGTTIYTRLPEEALCPYDQGATIIVVSKYAWEMRARLKTLGYEEKQIVEIPVNGGICATKDDSHETLDIEFQKVIKGFNLRKKIGQQELIVCQYGTGDVYYACALLPGYLRANEIARYTLAIPDGQSCFNVARLFDIPDVRGYSLQEISSLYKAWELLGSKRLRIRPVLNVGSRLPKKLVPAQDDGGVPEWYHWLNCMRYQYFAVTGVCALTAPKQRPYREVVEHYSQFGINEGRTVLLAPYANAFTSVLATQTDFWPQLAERLKRAGYDVLTNCSGEEQPVSGTLPICVSYQELIPFLNYAGQFVAIRSGLCDIAGSAQHCRMVMLYEAGSGIRPEMWSLKKMGIHHQCTDLLFTGSVENLLTQTLQAVTTSCNTISERTI